MTPSTPPRIARVVVEVEPFHLDRPFDYLVGDDLEDEVVVGSRVEVVFSGRRRRGLVVELADSTDVPDGRLRPLRRTFGPHAWATSEEIALWRWAADRWGGTLADVVRHALPGRTVAVERAARDAGWFPPTGQPPAGVPADVPADVPAVVPAADDLDRSPWARYPNGGADLRTAVADGRGGFLWRPMPGEDIGAAVVDLAHVALAAGRDVLVVTPDGASRAVRDVVARLRDLLDRDAVVDVRGRTGARATYRAWLLGRCGRACVVVGERGVAFWPLARFGLAVVLDEANPALKERRSPRHHVREVVLERARRAGAVAVLATNVPAAPTWRLLQDRRIVPVTAARADERAAAPRVQVDDGAGQPRTRLGRLAIPALRRAVAAGTYGVVLASRGGRGAALVCADCGTMPRCPTCGSSLRADGRDRRCGVCGWHGRPRPCASCGQRQVVPLAAGAEQLGVELGRAMDVPVAVLEGHDQPAPPPPAVLVMTRGSVMDRPPGPVGAVVLPDLDALSRRPDADAPEDALRLAMAIASWAPQGDGGEVVVRTDDPAGIVVQALVRWDPGGFWRGEVDRRAALGFPPVRQAVAIEDRGVEDLPGILAQLVPVDQRLGPLPTTDGWRRHLLLTDDRADLLARLRPPREAWSRAGREVRVDVDPVTLG